MNDVIMTQNRKDVLNDECLVVFSCYFDSRMTQRKKLER